MKKARKKRALIARNVLGWKIFDWVVLAGFVIIVLLGLVANASTPKVNRLIRSKMVRSEFRSNISIQVINGTGELMPVSKIVDRLRQEGFDVVDIDKLSHNIYPWTLLLLRKLNPDAADTVIFVCGLPRDRIVIQRNNQIYDMTLVIGRDYKTALSKLLGESFAVPGM